MAATSLSRMILVAINVTLLTCFALTANYRWRFDHCGSVNGSCVVTVRRWCSCGSPSADPTCSCPNSDDSNFEIATNITYSAPVVDSVKLLRSDANLSLSFKGLCDLTSCEIIPVPCEWSPWKRMIDSCMVQHSTRRRDKCCHPVDRRAIKASCYFQFIDYRRKFRTFDECYKPQSTSNDKGSSPPTTDENDFDSSNYDTSDDSSGSPLPIIVILGLISIFTLIFVCAAKKAQLRRRQAATPLQTMATRGRKPDVLIYPEPGHPVAVNRLPGYLRVERSA